MDEVYGRRVRITGNDWLFLLGLVAFVVFLGLAHPMTPSVRHAEFLFWAGLFSLLVTLGPTYVYHVDGRTDWRGPICTSRDRLVEAIRSTTDLTGNQHAALALFTLALGLVLASLGTFSYAPFAAASVVLARSMLA